MASENVNFIRISNEPKWSNGLHECGVNKCTCMLSFLSPTCMHNIDILIHLPITRVHTHIYMYVPMCVYIYIYLFIYSHTNGSKVQLVMKWLWCRLHNILSHMHHLYMAKSLRFWMKGKVISIIILLIFIEELKMNSRFGNWEVPSKYCSIRYKIIWA